MLSEKLVRLAARDRDALRSTGQKITMKTLDAKCLLDALTRAIQFQAKQSGDNQQAIVALTEVRDAVSYAINDKDDYFSPAGYPTKRMKHKREQRENKNL